MPASRLARDVTVDGLSLINEAIDKAGSLERLSEIVGYTRETLQSMRANNTLSRKLTEKLKQYICEEAIA